MTRRDPRDAVDTTRQRLQDGERGGTESARDLLLGISDNLDLIPSEVGDYRHRDILRRGVKMAEEVGGDTLVAALEDREAAEDIVRWINRNYDNEHTNQDYRKDLRAIGRYAGKITDDPPPSLSWVPTGTSNDFDPTPSERDLLLYEEEVIPMIEACSNARDEALIALQFEAGLRGGELQDLRVGDIFETDHTHAVHVDGKEGERVVHLLISVPYLTRWLSPDRHPAFDTDDVPLWSHLEKPESISDGRFRQVLRRAARKAGVDKSVTPTNFRKSNTRWLLKLGMKRHKIEQRQGRVHGSKHTARYEAEFGDESMETTYAALHGEDVDVSDGDIEVSPVICPRCKDATPQHLDFCIHCGQALDFEASELVETAIQALEREALEADERDDAEEFLTGARTLRQKPNSLESDALHRLASRIDESD